ncbi:MAG: type VI secretion system baseplate subunit TssK [Bryobacter sp.]|jgi:type VI secretion system protein ImpJ|nr:type VI secretion system baseplate subunit TssK [Bryobacter sp.]
MQSRLLQRVLWLKGTYLTPQHLQAQDRFLESLLQFRSGVLRTNGWGFQQLQLNHEALAGASVAVSSAEGLFPDGTPFAIPTSDAAPPARAIADHLRGDTREATVFLGIPEWRENSINIAPADRQLDTRYRADVAMLADENTGQTERPVAVARRNLRILIEGENRQGYELLPAGRVRRTEAGSFEYDAAFVPPMIDFHCAPALKSMARRLFEVLVARSSMLSALRRQKNESLAEFTSGDIANFWLLYTVNSQLPELRRLQDFGHPEDLFQMMSALASALTTFSNDTLPRDLPAYDHASPGAVFTELEAKLHYLLDTVVPSNFVTLPLRLVSPSIYATTLNEEKYLRGAKLYLAIRAETGADELIGKGPKLIKVCSAAHIEHLIRQALPGVPLLHQVRAPSAIPVKLNHEYFLLSQSGLAWEAIERSRTLAVYVPGDFPQPQLELVILLPESPLL